MSGFLDMAAKAPTVTVAELLQGRPLTVVAPHPDDETLACGALIHDAAALGVPITIICVTDGSRSHPNSATYPARRLADLRRSELEAAVDILAPRATVHWLGHPDCGIPSDATLPIPADALVLASWDGDPHIDHQVTACLARAQVRADALAFYPVWGRFTDATAPARLIHASVAGIAAKRRALACHRSQMTALIDDDPDGFVMEGWRQDHFLTSAEIVIA